MAEPEAAPRRAVRDWSFLYKLIGALALAGIAQGLFAFQRVGTTIGGFALLLIVIAPLLRPVLLRNRGSRLTRLPVRPSHIERGNCSTRPSLRLARRAGSRAGVSSSSRSF